MTHAVEDQSASISDERMSELGGGFSLGTIVE